MRKRVARIENNVTGTINHAYKCVGGVWVVCTVCVGGVYGVYSVCTVCGRCVQCEWSSTLKGRGSLLRVTLSISTDRKMSV